MTAGEGRDFIGTKIPLLIADGWIFYEKPRYGPPALIGDTPPGAPADGPNTAAHRPDRADRVHARGAAGERPEQRREPPEAQPPVPRPHRPHDRHPRRPVERDARGRPGERPEPVDGAGDRSVRRGGRLGARHG